MNPHVLDRAVAAALDVLRPPESVAFEVEKLLRWGACRPGMLAKEAHRKFGVRRNTTQERLKRAGMPPVVKLLAWGRLLVAFDRWSPAPNGRKRASCSLDDVAEVLGMDNGSSVSGFFRRYTGHYARALRSECPSTESVARHLAWRWKASVQPSAGELLAEALGPYPRPVPTLPDEYRIQENTR